jgi:hypothetical protein
MFHRALSRLIGEGKLPLNNIDLLVEALSLRLSSFIRYTIQSEAIAAMPSWPSAINTLTNSKATPRIDFCPHCGVSFDEPMDNAGGH